MNCSIFYSKDDALRSTALIHHVNLPMELNHRVKYKELNRTAVSVLLTTCDYTNSINNTHINCGIVA